MVLQARMNGAVVIGDIIPGHSGKGADFRLAERGYADYPGLYHMVRSSRRTGACSACTCPQRLGEPQAGHGRRLKARGYIVGQLPLTIFYEKNVKETDWTATDAVVGADGRRAGGSISTTSRKGSRRSTGWIPPSPRSGSSWRCDPLPGHAG